MDVSSPLARGDTATLQRSLDRGVSQLENVLPHFGRVLMAEWQWCGSPEAAQGEGLCRAGGHTLIGVGTTPPQGRPGHNRD